MEKVKKQLLLAARAELDKAEKGGTEGDNNWEHLHGSPTTVVTKQDEHDRRHAMSGHSDEHKHLSENQHAGNATGSGSRRGSKDGSVASAAHSSSSKKSRKKGGKMTKMQLAETIDVLGKESKKTKNPVRRKEICLELGNLYIKAGQGKRAMPWLKEATHHVKRAEMIEMTLGIDADMFDAEDDEEDQDRMRQAEDEERRRVRAGHWALGLLHLLDDVTYDPKECVVNLTKWLGLCPKVQTQRVWSVEEQRIVGGHKHIGPPPAGSERLRSLRALESVLSVAEDIYEYTCQLNGTLADEEARHIHHSLLDVKDLRVRVNEELVGVGVGEEMTVHGGGTAALDALGWLYSDRRELVESRQLLEHSERVKTRVPFSGLRNMFRTDADKKAELDAHT